MPHFPEGVPVMTGHVITGLWQMAQGGSVLPREWLTAQGFLQLSCPVGGGWSPSTGRDVPSFSKALFLLPHATR